MLVGIEKSVPLYVIVKNWASPNFLTYYCTFDRNDFLPYRCGCKQQFFPFNVVPTFSVAFWYMIVSLVGTK